MIKISTSRIPNKDQANIFQVASIGMDLILQLKTSMPSFSTFRIKAQSSIQSNKLNQGPELNKAQLQVMVDPLITAYPGAIYSQTGAMGFNKLTRSIKLTSLIDINKRLPCVARARQLLLHPGLQIGRAHV